MKWCQKYAALGKPYYDGKIEAEPCFQRILNKVRSSIKKKPKDSRVPFVGILAFLPGIFNIERSFVKRPKKKNMCVSG